MSRVQIWLKWVIRTCKCHRLFIVATAAGTEKGSGVCCWHGLGNYRRSIHLGFVFWDVAGTGRCAGGKSSRGSPATPLCPATDSEWIATMAALYHRARGRQPKIYEPLDSGQSSADGGRGRPGRTRSEKTDESEQAACKRLPTPFLPSPRSCSTERVRA
jgi:hypothetical protein